MHVSSRSEHFMHHKVSLFIIKKLLSSLKSLLHHQLLLVLLFKFLCFGTTCSKKYSVDKQCQKVKHQESRKSKEDVHWRKWICNLTPQPQLKWSIEWIISKSRSWSPITILIVVWVVLLLTHSLLMFHFLSMNLFHEIIE